MKKHISEEIINYLTIMHEDTAGEITPYDIVNVFNGYDDQKEALKVLRDMEKAEILRQVIKTDKQTNSPVFRLAYPIRKDYYFIYETPPIDYFLGMMPLSQYIKKSIAMEMEHESEDTSTITNILSMVCEAIIKVKDATIWEGDFNTKMYVFAIPDVDNTDMKIGFVWKQENNGTSFVVSPVSLPWLDQYLKVYYDDVF